MVSTKSNKTVEIRAERIINAPVKNVWDVLSDIGGIANWNSGVKKSYLTSELKQGVNAQRTCELSGLSKSYETVLEFIPEEKLVISTDKTFLLSVKSAITTFSLEQKSPTVTEVVVVSNVVPRGLKLISSLISKKLKTRLIKDLSILLKELDVAAQKRSEA